MKTASKSMIMVTAVGASLLFVSSAFAGTNGQQVDVGGGPPGGCAVIQGRNQDGQRATSPKVDFDRSGEAQLPGWWWVGKVTINVFDADGSPLEPRSCEVPSSQREDWTACDPAGLAERPASAPANDSGNAPDNDSGSAPDND